MDDISTITNQPRVIKQNLKNNCLDLHTHILPGIDDGSKSVDESLQILATLEECGINTVVFTPHFYSDSSTLERFVSKRQSSYEALKPHLAALNMEFRLGAEVYFFDGISKSTSLDDLKIEGTKYLLVEMPFSKWTDRTISEIIELNARADVNVIIAHIDRYFKYVSEKNVEKLVRSGVLLQMNIDALLSWKTRSRMKKLISNKMIHFFGSDAHNTTTRSPRWKEIEKYGDIKPLYDRI